MSGETGKRFEWQLARAYGDPFFTALQDYDWADEVLHAQIGRRWLKDEFPTRSDLSSAGNGLMERWEASLAASAERSSGRAWWPEFVTRARDGQPPTACA